jgi:hypothetical protein
MLFITKKNCIHVAQQIIAEYYPSIVADLSIPSVDVDVQGFGAMVGHMGVCNARYMRPEFDILNITGVFVAEQTNISIFALEHLYTAILPKYRLRTVFFYKTFEKKIVNTLAHECRHVWQHVYNTYRDSLLTVMFTPYSTRESEVDARNYSKLYIKNKYVK